MSIGNTRKGFTQATFNDDASNVLMGEILIASIVGGVFFEKGTFFSEKKAPAGTPIGNTRLVGGGGPVRTFFGKFPDIFSDFSENARTFLGHV